MRNLLIACAVVGLLCGCGANHPTMTTEYSRFAPSSPETIPLHVDTHGGGVFHRMTPKDSFGYSIDGINIRNVSASPDVEVHVNVEQYAKGYQSITWRVENVDDAKTARCLRFDIFQNGQRRESVSIKITPPPGVQATIVSQMADVDINDGRRSTGTSR